MEGEEAGEKAAVRPVSDYIIAQQDLKQGLRKKQKTASKQKRFHCHRTTATSNLPNHCGNFITSR